jgi:uroporphyrinogen decarboxylase
MTSRERIIAALNFRAPDRIPVDFGGHRSSGIHAMTYSRLKKALGITTGNVYVYDMIQQLAIIEEPVLDLLHGDTIELGRSFLLDDSSWKDWVLPDGTPCKIPFFINVERKGDDWRLLGNNGKELGIQRKGCYYFETLISRTRIFQGLGIVSNIVCGTPLHLPGDILGLNLKDSNN